MFLQRCAAYLLLVAGLSLTAVAIAEEEKAAVDTTQYVDLKPAFVTNYGGVGRLRYLKTDIALRIESQGIPGIRHHMPQLRHTLVMLLSRQTEEDLSTMEGKELLRQNALEAVRNVLLEEDGEQYVHDLLFKSLIVQR
jgi:flagellar FliL protein